MSLRAIFLRPPNDESVAALLAALSDDVDLCVAPKDLQGLDAEVLIEGTPREEQIDALASLRRVIVPWAGLPVETRELMLRRPGVTVHNLHHNAAATAEMAMALLLAAAKQVIPIDRALRRGDWTPRYAPSDALGLDGATALVLGYGAIGRRIAAACRGLGMRVIATKTDPSTAPPDCPDEVRAASELHTLLPRANVLLICLPHTPETEGLIGDAELGRLPDGAVLVNVGRAAIVDQRALFIALRDRRLLAAGLDVWYNYPSSGERMCTMPADYPFDELDNVVMSPHRGGMDSNIEAKRMEALAALLNAEARGEPMPNRVDLGRGY